MHEGGGNNVSSVNEGTVRVADIVRVSGVADGGVCVTAGGESGCRAVHVVR